METNLTTPNEDLQTIRKMMERSSKFLSLSGLSGIFAGICALIGAAVAWYFFLDEGRLVTSAGLSYFVWDALLVLGFAVFGAFYFSYRKAKKSGQPFWTSLTKRVLVHLLIPLFCGGIFSIILISRNEFELIPSAMLIFYGLSLVNSGKFTLSEVHYLGLTEIVLGILAGIFTQYGLLLWTAGFGVMHIIYGAVMYYRHDRS